MKKILFYIQNTWCHGRIHNDLIKALWPDIYCDILDWTKGYSIEEYRYFLKKYDYIITDTYGAEFLNINYHISPNRIGIIAHSNDDILHITKKSELGEKYFTDFKGYATVSSTARTFSLAHGVQRIPQVLKIGCFNNLSFKNSSEKLEKIGFIGEIEIERQKNSKTFNKRGFLVQKVCELTGLEFVNIKNLHFHAASEFYNSFDLLMFASLMEGLPTVAIEAFSCGIPVLGTDTGIFSQMASSGGGVILPFEEEKFIDEGVKIVNFLKQNPKEYQKMCSTALEESKKYDWSVARTSWINFINSLYE